MNEDEQRLLLRCARVRLTAADVAEIQALAALDLNWAAIATEATRQRVTPLLHLNLARAGAGRPDLADSYHRIAAENLQLTLSAGKIVGFLQAAGISCVCLKGPALSISAYGSFSLREFGDLDLLVTQLDVERTVALLYTHGYAFSGDHQPRPGESLFADPSTYHVALSSPDGLIVELHWSLSGRLFRFTPDSASWSALRSIPSPGGGLPALPMEEELLFLCLHGARHYWNRLIWIVDIAALIQTTPPLDWPRTFSLARRHGATRSLVLALQLVQAVLNVPLPKTAAARMPHNARLDSIVKGLAIRLFDPQHPLFGVRISWWAHHYQWILHERATDRIRLLWHKKPRLAPGPRDASALMRPLRLFRTYVPQLWSVLKSKR